MTATTATDAFIGLIYLAAAARRMLIVAWHATAPERNTPR